MIFDTLITGGTLHSASLSAKADIAISGQTIAAVAAPGSIPRSAASRVIDADGMEVIPGCLDVHVHLALPFCGTVSCDDFDSGSRAAAAGCITTLIDFAIPSEGRSLADADAAWHEKSRGRSIVDYAWHLAVTGRRHLDEIRPMIQRGLPTFKQFMIYESEGWNADDAMLFAALEQVRAGGMLLLHAESPRILDLLIARHHTPELMRRSGAMLHALTRPNFIEAEAIERAIHFSRVTDAPLYIVHMSTAQGADLVRAARAQGVPVWAETCAQYLCLDDRVFSRPDGHLFACCPQVKKPADIQRLWRGLADEIAVVSTDTCSFTRQQKDMWRTPEGYGDWTRIPMGLPGLDTLVPIMYTLGVRQGRISMNDLVRLCAAAPARLMGLGHRKGRIAPGFDADLAIIDPARTIQVVPQGRDATATIQSRCDWSPYEGWELGGFAHTTLVRGKTVVENHRVCATPGHGVFLSRHTVARL
ncbi:MAG: amidohydrolase family protein [Phycisphaerales bacterium]